MNNNNQRWNSPPPGNMPPFPQQSYNQFGAPPTQQGGHHYNAPTPNASNNQGGYSQHQGQQGYYPGGPPPPPMQNQGRFQHQKAQQDSWQNQPRFGGPPQMGQNRSDNRFSGPSSGNMRPQAYGRFQGPPNTGPSNFNRQPGPYMNRPRFNPGNGNNQFKKKEKVDKRELPENNKFYCDSCDRGFKDEATYTGHVNAHEKCSEPGCTYVAASKLVQLHIKLQHKSGFAKKIWSMDTPEDIKKWKEERKKNFPTAENVSKKKAVMDDKIARGEVIEEKYFGKMRGQNGRGRGRGQGKGRGRQDRNNRGEKTETGTKGDNDNSETNKGDNETNNNNKGGNNVDKKRKLPSDTREAECSLEKLAKTADGDTDALALFFGGAASDSDNHSDDDNNTSTSAAVLSQSKIAAAGALGSLIDMYSVSDEDTPSKVTEGDDHQDDKEHKFEKRPRQRRNKKNKNKNKTNSSQTVDKSLLEKLLAKEIRQERNKILQCVHYIVQNNFFDKTVTSENS